VLQIFRRLYVLPAVLLPLFCFAIAADGPFEGTQPVPTDYQEGFSRVTEQESRELLAKLVEGEMSGRGTGQEGYLHAARWFAGQLENCGFKPAGDNGTWFQNMPFIRMNTVPDQCAFRVGETAGVTGEHLGISTWSGAFTESLPVSFVVLGEKSPEIAEGAFSGRLLVVQGRGRLTPENEWILRGKPACMLLVQQEARVRNETVNQNETAPSAFPSATVVRSAANALAGLCGVSSTIFPEGDAAESLIVSSTQPVNCQLTLEREPIDVPNVVGWYPGSDETVRNEHICIGAHLDHLGAQRGEVYPGADDNGSGSAAILQIAQAIHANPLKPRRSVLMMAFCAEERGLLGSKYYASNPLKPLDDMICMLNIDMIGRDEEKENEPASENRNSIHLVGSQLESTALHKLIEAANQHVGFVFEYDEETTVAYRSDQASFAEKGIPVSFLFGGFNPFYHKTTDTLEGINFSKIANAARLNYLVLMMASEHGRFEKDVKKEAPKP
jgi:hypothetical protein